MQAERIRVLELVKNGTITIEQADELIDALQTANQPTYPSSSSEFRMPEPPRPPKPPRAPRASGGGKFSFEQMIELGKFGINTQYVRSLADAGLSNLSFDDIIEFGKFGIQPDYVIQLQNLAEELEMDELDSEKIIELGKFGVDVKNVREMLESGLFDLSGADNTHSDHIEHDVRQVIRNARDIEKAAHHAAKSIPHTDDERERFETKIEMISAKLGQAQSDKERQKLEAKRYALQVILDTMPKTVTTVTRVTSTETTDDEVDE